jgi:nicotinamidase-related amidase
VEKVWNKFLTDRDRAVFAASGYGTHGGFGQKPALLIIDVSYGFTGDRSEPILESIKHWRNSCGAEAWGAVKVIKDLADLSRAKRLPVIYTTGFGRTDNWDAGSWAWKNRRLDRNHLLRYRYRSQRNSFRNTAATARHRSL